MQALYSIVVHGLAQCFTSISWNGSSTRHKTRISRSRTAIEQPNWNNGGTGERSVDHDALLLTAPIDALETHHE